MEKIIADRANRIVAEVREQYKQAVREYLGQSSEFNRDRMSGLATSLGCLGVSIPEIDEICHTCEEEVKDEDEQEREQEELDAIERPVSQAKVECQITLEHIQARFASPATPEDIQKAVQAFKDGFKEWEASE